jgi:hypothetical protein
VRSAPLASMPAKSGEQRRAGLGKPHVSGRPVPARSCARSRRALRAASGSARGRGSMNFMRSARPRCAARRRQDHW